MRNFLLSGTTGTDSDLSSIAGTLMAAMKAIVGPILIVVGAAAAIYCIYLGVMYAKAEDANKRKEVQGRLIGAAIGVIIIIVGVTLCYTVDWAKLVTGFKITE